jgi:hypothetical protein
LFSGVFDNRFKSKSSFSDCLFPCFIDFSLLDIGLSLFSFDSISIITSFFSFKKVHDEIFNVKKLFSTDSKSLMCIRLKAQLFFIN